MRNSLLLILIGALRTTGVMGQTIQQKPNILFIFADDQRYGTMGAVEMDQPDWGMPWGTAK